MVRAAANGRVYGVAGTVVITRARGEGGARSGGAGRAWRTGRALGMVAEKVGMAWACGPVAGIARGWDREWRWGASLLPDKVGEASVARSLLSTMGWQWCSRPAHHYLLTVVLVIS